MFKIGCVIFTLYAVSATAFEGENAYGLGVHSDIYGRPVTFEDEFGQRAQQRVDVDAYGPGVGSDDTGRAVRARRLFDDGEVLPGDIDTSVPRRGFTPLDR